MPHSIDNSSRNNGQNSAPGEQEKLAEQATRPVEPTVSHANRPHGSQVLQKRRVEADTWSDPHLQQQAKRRYRASDGDSRSRQHHEFSIPQPQTNMGNRHAAERAQSAIMSRSTQSTSPNASPSSSLTPFVLEQLQAFRQKLLSQTNEQAENPLSNHQQATGSNPQAHASAPSAPQNTTVEPPHKRLSKASANALTRGLHLGYQRSDLLLVHNKSSKSLAALVRLSPELQALGFSPNALAQLGMAKNADLALASLALDGKFLLDDGFKHSDLIHMGFLGHNLLNRIVSDEEARLSAHLQYGNKMTGRPTESESRARQNHWTQILNSLKS